MLTGDRRSMTVVRRQRGLSLVEMMVGVAIGLIVVAGASLMVATQLAENRKLLVETQLQQDLRAAVDIVSRELRRTGAQLENHALTNRWFADGGVHKSQWNANSDYSGTPVCGSDPDCFDFAYEVADQQIGPFGFKLVGGVIKTYLPGQNAGPGTWQDLTDGNVMNVTSFSVTDRPGAPANLTQLPCPKLCTGGGTACWPSVRTRELLVSITAQDRASGAVTRTMTSRVRLRNDQVDFFDKVSNEICPT